MKLTKMCFVAGTMIATASGAQAIETIQPGDQVWSRDPQTMVQRVKPVVDTVMTHPVELFHLRYSLPASSGDGLSAAGSGSVAEIVCTGEHPFYVGNRAQPDFVPARELQPGDSLTFSSGGQGQVLSLASERAPPGETFTTYNFEVADFHTYFAGEGGVWVHNNGAWCQTLFAMYEKALKSFSGKLWETYDDLLLNAAKYPGLASLEGRWTLRLFNDVRARHILGKGTLGEIPRWLDPSRIANQITGKGHHPTSTLVENMKRMFGFKCSNQFTPHHIVPGGYDGMERPMKIAVDRAKAVLKRYNIDINDGANGTYLRNRMGKDLDPSVYGPLHNGPPSRLYVEEVADRLEKVQDLGADKVRGELQKIAADIVANKLPL